MTETISSAENAKNSEQNELSGKEIQMLAIFEGRWQITGHNFPVTLNGLETDVYGEDEYSWLPGNFFLMDKWQHLTKSSSHIGISILGFDEEEQKLFSRNFDNLGFERRYFLMYDGNSWKFDGPQERSVRVYSMDKLSYTEHWEMKDGNGAWMPLCVMNGKKMSKVK